MGRERNALETMTVSGRRVSIWRGQLLRSLSAHCRRSDEGVGRIAISVDRFGFAIGER
jgi:hypothetical protein